MVRPANNTNMEWHASLNRVEQGSPVPTHVATARPEQNLQDAAVGGQSNLLEMQRLQESQDRLRKDLMSAQQTLDRSKQFVELQESISTTDWRVALESLCSLQASAIGPEHEARLIRVAVCQAQQIRETIGELDQSPATFNVALHHHAQVTNFTRLPAWSGSDARCRAIEALLSWIRYCAVQEIAHKTGTKFQDPVYGDQFVSELHEEAGSVGTEDSELDGKITECLQPGFSPKLKARVRRFTFQAAGTNEVTPNESIVASFQPKSGPQLADNDPIDLRTELPSLIDTELGATPQTSPSDQSPTTDDRDDEVAEFRPDAIPD